MSGEAKRLRQLKRALAKLDGPSREVFLMSAAERLSYAEIAERLGMSTEDVELHMARALYQLAGHIARMERLWWRFWG